MGYTIPGREIPVYGTYDVCVVGGGTAGVIAALSAAREGLSVLIVEQFGSLGGSGTVGLVLPVMPTCMEGNPQCSYFGERINRTLSARGYNMPDTDDNRAWQDSLYLKFILDELCREYGVEVLFHAFFNTCIREGNRITGVTCATKAGEQAIFAKRVIDCTGDADVAVAMGCCFAKGDPETGKNQPTSLRYIVGGIDLPRFQAFVNAHSEHPHPYDYPHIYGVGSRGKGNMPLDRYFEKAVADGELDPMDYKVWMVFPIPGRHDGLCFNCPEFRDNTDSLDLRTASWMHMDGRRRIERHLRFYKKYFEGFENAYVAEISEMVGVRESRRIEAEYVLTGEDVLHYRKFADSICQNRYPVDIHGADFTEHDCFVFWEKLHDPYPYYDIPYRIMVPRHIEGLLVAGRCAGMDFVAHGAARMQNCCRAMGEAAGIAARLSIENDQPFSDVDGRTVRHIMIDKGAVFHEMAPEYR